MNSNHGGNVHQRAYHIVALHMMEWNPMKLREWCLPHEYNIEIEHIINVLPHVHSSDELGQQLYWIMQKYFGAYAKCTDRECYDVAERMYADLQAVPEKARPLASFQVCDDRIIFGIREGSLYRRSDRSD
ncbi:hypothetical protein L2089_04475 [Paenibacillus hunanensis]|uniref:hypothetical protein n=1 Tax=Paenibacillus hunanensis TaxID=539262 RepID=UPI002026F334|nr:hypothetical protein [Paenibacillus hunanensis]MCL9659928.1 hypothetical protein [Paenibacillus hunanensis]